MAAIELMDRKVDIGMDQSEFLTLDTALRDKKLPLQLAPQQVLEVIDQLAVMDALWQDGQALGQTVFQCLFLHSTPAAVAEAKKLLADAGFASSASDSSSASESKSGAGTNASATSSADVPLSVARPNLLPVLVRVSPLLRVWCLSLLKRIAQLRDMIHRADIYEEDDFNGCVVFFLSERACVYVCSPVDVPD